MSKLNILVQLSLLKTDNKQSYLHTNVADLGFLLIRAISPKDYPAVRTLISVIFKTIQLVSSIFSYLGTNMDMVPFRIT